MASNVSLKKVDSISRLYALEGELGDRFRYANLGFEELIGELIAANIDPSPLLAATGKMELKASLSLDKADIEALITLYENLVKCADL